MNASDTSGYTYTSAKSSHIHAYLLPTLKKYLSNLDLCEKRLFDLGCGNGSMANELTKKGWKITGVDASEQGIQQANINYPELNLYKGSAYDNLSDQFGTYPVVLSLEVVEHVYAPRDYARTLFNLTEEGGVAIISTPYHGYLKNMALSISGKMDSHFTALWDHGHIKFWSIKTLTILLQEVGFKNISFTRLGRVPPFAKTMIAYAHKS